MAQAQVCRYVTTFPYIKDPSVRSAFTFCNKDKFGQMSDDELAQHIVSVRDEAFKIAMWPCLGWFLFMPALIRRNPPKDEYARTIKELCADRSLKVLDLGCMFGHDTRAMIEDGVEPQQCTASDLMPELLQLGHKLFGDDANSPHLKGVRFINADIFKQEDVQKLSVPGGYHAIHIGAFLHLFSNDAQEKVVKSMHQLLSTKAGSVILGGHVGRHEGESAAPLEDESIQHGPRGLFAKMNGSPQGVYINSPSTFLSLFERSAGGQDSWSAVTEFKSYNLPAGTGEPMMSMERASFVANNHVFCFALRRK